MIEHLLDSTNNQAPELKNFKSFQYAQQLTYYQNQAIDFKQFDIAILGWDNPHHYKIQDALYKLSTNFKPNKVLDLGLVKPNLIPLIELVDLLLKNQVLPIIISPNIDCIQGQLKAYEQQHKGLNVAMIDSDIPFELGNDNAIINTLLKYHPQLLSHLSCIGYQSYLTNPSSVDFLEDKYFEMHRLGRVQARLDEIEPIVRDVDLAAFSLESIRSADAPANSFKNPNGLFAAQACKIMRYISMNDRLSSLSIHGFDLALEEGGQSANMIAQLVWFAIEGFRARLQEYPIDKADLIAYVVDNKLVGMPLSFYKSSKSNRWWFEIPPSLNKKHHLIACSYQDYHVACEGELPDRLLNAINRLA